MIKSRRTALIRCDASTRIGYGHIVRCIALAEQMQRDFNWHVIFSITEDAGGIHYAQKHGFQVESLPGPLESHREGKWLVSVANRVDASALILDVRSELPCDTVQKIRNNGTLVVSIDDISERRLGANLAFYPPIPQVSKMDWSGFDGKLLIGWPWIMMPTQFAVRATCEKAKKTELPSVLITMGVSDPEGLTLKVLASIDSLSEEFTTRIVLGTAFTHNDLLSNWLATSLRSYEILRDPPSMAAVMSEADLAIASFGVTAYELACVGVPAIYLCRSADHALSAMVLDQAGAGVSLGEYSKVSAIDIQKKLQNWLVNAEARGQSGERGRHLIDGKGAVRIARAIDEAWHKRHRKLSG